MGEKELYLICNGNNHWDIFYQNCFLKKIECLFINVQYYQEIKTITTKALVYFRCNVFKHKLKRRSLSISNLLIYNRYFLMNKRRFLDFIFVTLCTSVLLNVQFKYKRK